MTRFTLTAAAALVLTVTPAVAPALAQTPVQTAPAKASPAAADPAPGSEDWLRLRGEAYSAAPDAEQDPVELAATARLNAEIAARNDAAEQTEAKDQAVFEQNNAAWQAETARLETQRAQWEADAAAAAAARAQWERDRAAWAAEVAACERARRICVTTAPKG